MCNLYNFSRSHDEVRRWTDFRYDRAGNTPESLNVYPNYEAPVVRVCENGERELVRCRWGMPTPPKFVKGEHDTGVTNIRNVKSPHWRRWLGTENRCLVPATSFSEYATKRDPETGKKPLYWFGLTADDPMFFFAGIWTDWHGKREAKEDTADHQIFAFLTTEPNGVVEPIHQKAMPVILTKQEELDQWLSAEWDEARELQRPLPYDALQIVDTPERPD